MALDKNKSGIMAAISAATEGKAPIYDRAHRSLPKGTVGSVRAGIGGIQEIDTALIQSWGPQDRLELTAVNPDAQSGELQDIAQSIAASGQQVPVLLRPSRNRDGHFDVVYGRRRILACRQLGIPVKALIRTLDDTEALMAKGLENAGRADLSYYERARFAKAILEQGHTREQVMQALAISKNTLSQLERITRLIPDAVGEFIGAAPKAGRPKWMALASAFETGGTSEEQVLSALTKLGAEADSDTRLEAALAAFNARGPKERTLSERTPVPGVTVKSGKSSVALSVKRAGENKAFADWLDQNIDQLIQESYRSFQERLEDSAS
ncbi:plasmid partitioning protein RepB [Litoreibacter arenae]|uniref:Plasmid replication protein RepB n=1 Tax=Litoreibacter arenae DSM 19593 TaxID=1123360 RepID=S9QFA6_9RHOB|nr:plasmid partitioning protein RepB [Litoreibacter arenae]EPX78283.1 Plasmid replication protein RepB [Litoreibacter arenae DSM 19593]